MRPQLTAGVESATPSVSLSAELDGQQPPAHLEGQAFAAASWEFDHVDRRVAAGHARVRYRHVLVIRAADGSLPCDKVRSCMNDSRVLYKTREQMMPGKS